MRKVELLALLFATILVSSCSSFHPISDGAPPQMIDAKQIPNAVPKVEPKSRYGNPASYVVNNHRYYVLPSAQGYSKTGIASWYGTKFHGHLTSTREIYNMFGMTAASTVLPLPTFVKVTDLENGRQIIVKVNDRGPFDKDRILDLSYAAAEKLGFAQHGTALVRVTAIDPSEWQRQHHNTTTPPVLQQARVTHTPRLYLQYGAFAKEANAQSQQQKLRQKTTLPVTINKQLIAHKTIYKVMLGPIQAVADNDKLQQQLERLGFGHGMPVVQ